MGINTMETLLPSGFLVTVLQPLNFWGRSDDYASAMCIRDKRHPTNFSSGNIDGKKQFRKVKSWRFYLVSVAPLKGSKLPKIRFSSLSSYRSKLGTSFQQTSYPFLFRWSRLHYAFVTCQEIWTIYTDRLSSCPDCSSGSQECLSDRFYRASMIDSLFRQLVYILWLSDLSMYLYSPVVWLPILCPPGLFSALNCLFWCLNSFPRYLNNTFWFLHNLSARLYYIECLFGYLKIRWFSIIFSVD